MEICINQEMLNPGQFSVEDNSDSIPLEIVLLLGCLGSPLGSRTISKTSQKTAAAVGAN
ncbi:MULTISPECIES: hypothetical protein [Cyanophyceae]|uniref:hypothetical protein n=1 Tax=Cyanophyceae TaxID=3028117 RepID=UPI0012DD9FD6|nr:MULTISPECIES: hypothetical protein [Cyanophyceae]